MRLTDKYTHLSIYGGHECEYKLGQLEDILENYNIEDVKELDSLLKYVKQLKHIEEELGIDLITLFKVLTASKLAVRHDVHFNDGKVHTHNVYKIEIIKRLKAIHITWSTLWIGDNNLHNNNIYYFKDYGKTWALTREELL